MHTLAVCADMASLHGDPAVEGLWLHKNDGNHSDGGEQSVLTRPRGRADGGCRSARSAAQRGVTRERLGPQTTSILVPSHFHAQGTE